MQTTTNIENQNRKGKKMEKSVIIRATKNGKYHIVRASGKFVVARDSLASAISLCNKAKVSFTIEIA
jgi:hypothetical protein